MPINTPTELGGVFFATATNHAGERGYEFNIPTRTLIQRHANEGANAIFGRIQQNGVDPYHPIILRTITEAEYHEKRFIDYMIVNHRRRQGQGGLLEDVDFQFSSSWFSPMWPFCT